MPDLDIARQSELDFETQTSFIADHISDVPGTYTVRKRAIYGEEGVWFAKEMDHPFVALRELLGQEFFRLIIPYQPKTRIARNALGVSHILSQEIEGFRPLTGADTPAINDGTYQGLGQAMVTAMFLQETDFKNGNVGIGGDKIIKIDGDWCFTSLNPGEKGIFRLTPEAISSLPKPQDFYADNWLDWIVSGKRAKRSELAELSKSTLFRAEVNEGLLKIISLPNTYIKNFVESYTSPPQTQRFSNLIISRQKVLKASALQNASFRRFLTSPEAKTVIEQQALHVSNFHYGAHKVIPEAYESVLTALQKHSGIRYPVARKAAISLPKAAPVSKAVVAERRALSSQERPLLKTLREQRPAPAKKEAVAPRPPRAAPAVRDDGRLKTETGINNFKAEVKARLRGMNTNKKDVELNKFIQAMNDELGRAITSNQVTKIMNNIERASGIMNSTEVRKIQQTIENFRKNAGFFSVGKNKKADEIEAALYKIPLMQRGTIISDKSNEVLKALAKHRHAFKENPIKNNEINEKKAASSFKRLKEEVKNLKKEPEKGGLILGPGKGS